MKTLKIAFWTAYVPFSIWLRSVCVMLLWNWFIHPMGPDAIGKGLAYGISCFAALFAYHDFKKDQNPIETACQGTALSGLILLGGYLTQRFWL